MLVGQATTRQLQATLKGQNHLSQSYHVGSIEHISHVYHFVLVKSLRPLRLPKTCLFDHANIGVFPTLHVHLLFIKPMQEIWGDKHGMYCCKCAAIPNSVVSSAWKRKSISLALIYSQYSIFLGILDIFPTLRKKRALMGKNCCGKGGRTLWFQRFQSCKNVLSQQDWHPRSNQIQSCKTAD